MSCGETYLRNLDGYGTAKHQKVFGFLVLFIGRIDVHVGKLHVVRTPSPFKLFFPGHMTPIEVTQGEKSVGCLFTGPMWGDQ